VWDPKNSTSKQEIIKYLGNANNITKNDIPAQYRNDPRITAFLTLHNTKNRKANQAMLLKLRNNMLKEMSTGNIDNTLFLFKTFLKSHTLINFYDELLTPVMYDIGDLWKHNKLTSATEHITSNVAHRLLQMINQEVSKPDSKGKILLCTPEGEWHTLGCNVIESVLLSKGYSVQNISPSLPHDSVINHIEKIQPDAIMISITLKENIRSAQRLILKIRSKNSVPIFVGGQAIKETREKFDTMTMKEGGLNEMLKLLKLTMNS
jgi:methanogenic corrinoid protein MtbC1